MMSSNDMTDLKGLLRDQHDLSLLGEIHKPYRVPLLIRSISILTNLSLVQLIL